MTENDIENKFGSNNLKEEQDFYNNIELSKSKDKL